MATAQLTDSRRGVTVTEIVVVVLALVVVAAMVLPALSRAREESARRKCRHNLRYLAKGMATYLNEHGDDRWYPCPLGRTRDPETYNGAEWLAALYWSGVLPDPGAFICPSSPDTNDDGLDIGTHLAAATFGSQTVSYAGLHFYSQMDMAGAASPGSVRASFPSDAPMASDDTQGEINHLESARRAEGMNVVFFDTHVEFLEHTELDLERAVGQEGGLLWQLRN